MVVYTGYGDGSLKPALFDELKAAGITIIYRDINPTPENSRRAEQAGADIIVATGFDEGGTLPGTALGTFTIVPLIVDAVQWVPVMAAGGITDARGARRSCPGGGGRLRRFGIYQHHRKPGSRLGESENCGRQRSGSAPVPYSAGLLPRAARQTERHTGGHGPGRRLQDRAGPGDGRAARDAAGHAGGIPMRDISRWARGSATSMPSPPSPRWSTSWRCKAASRGTVTGAIRRRPPSLPPGRKRR